MTLLWRRGPARIAVNIGQAAGAGVEVMALEAAKAM
jgi:hypothetical protein